MHKKACYVCGDQVSDQYFELYVSLDTLENISNGFFGESINSNSYVLCFRCQASSNKRNFSAHSEKLSPNL